VSDGIEGIDPGWPHRGRLAPTSSGVLWWRTKDFFLRIENEGNRTGLDGATAGWALAGPDGSHFFLF
jgi:hypothetical protein